jgi:steroid delta-isomerase-like uncharacterized protein
MVCGVLFEVGGCYVTAEENMEVLRKIIQAFNDRDLAVAPTLVTSGFVRHDLASAFVDVRGREEVVDFMQIILKALPDVHVAIEDLFATEDRAAMRVTVSGTHQGEFQNIAPTGKKVKFSTFNLYRFKEGKLAEFWQLIDVANFLRQIGGLDS